MKRNELYVALAKALTRSRSGARGFDGAKRIRQGIDIVINEIIDELRFERGFDAEQFKVDASYGEGE